MAVVALLYPRSGFHTGGKAVGGGEESSENILPRDPGFGRLNLGENLTRSDPDGPG